MHTISHNLLKYVNVPDACAFVSTDGLPGVSGDRR